MVSFARTLRVYEIFNKYFKNDEDAKVLASEIEELVNTKVMTERETLATKNDLSSVRNELMTEISSVRHDLSLEISSLKATMEFRFQEQLKWMIVLMVGFLSLVTAVMKFL